VFIDADIVSSDSGSRLFNSKEDWLGWSYNSLCIPDGEIDLSVEKFCGLMMGTSVDAVDRKLFEPGRKQLLPAGLAVTEETKPIHGCILLQGRRIPKHRRQFPSLRVPWHVAGPVGLGQHQISPVALTRIPDSAACACILIYSYMPL
jgi:hypothetical protein